MKQLVKQLNMHKLFYVFTIGLGCLVTTAITHAQELPNPLAAGQSRLLGITFIVGRVVSALLGVIGVVSLVVFVVGAYYYLTAGGNPEKIKQGTTTLVWAIIGIIIAFGSYAILEFILSRIGG